MYAPASVAHGCMAGGVCGALAFTGFGAAHLLVAGATLLFLGGALLRLTPRREG